jgi:hypothetical protein
MGDTDGSVVTQEVPSERLEATNGPSAEALADAVFYAGVRINDFARHVVPVDLPPRTFGPVST